MNYRSNHCVLKLCDCDYIISFNFCGKAMFMLDLVTTFTVHLPRGPFMRRHILDFSCTVLVLRMAHRIRKETKQQPGTAGPGNMLDCFLVSFHFLWGKLSTRTKLCLASALPRLVRPIALPPNTALARFVCHDVTGRDLHRHEQREPRRRRHR